MYICTVGFMMIQSKIIYFGLYTKLYFTATSKSTLNIYKFYKEVRKEVDHKDAPESKINTFDIQGVQEKLSFFHNSLQPLPHLQCCKRP